MRVDSDLDVDVDASAVRGVFVSGTNTGVGKTSVVVGLLGALRARGIDALGIKPLETGIAALAQNPRVRSTRLRPLAALRSCKPSSALAQEEPNVRTAPALAQLPSDAARLAQASASPVLGTEAGLYRTDPPVAPYAAELMGASPPVDVHALVRSTRHAASKSEFAVIEGAGGLLVPITKEHDIAYVAQQLGLPLLIVASNSLGTLSATLCTVQCAQHRNLQVAAVLLNQHQPPDASSEHNLRILRERLSVPVLAFAQTDDSDQALARAAEQCGVIDVLLNERATSS